MLTPRTLWCLWRGLRLPGHARPNRKGVQWCAAFISLREAGTTRSTGAGMPRPMYFLEDRQPLSRTKRRRMCLVRAGTKQHPECSGIELYTIMRSSSLGNLNNSRQPSSGTTRSASQYHHAT